MAYISSDGNVYPCPSMPLALGNLRETPLKSILSSAYKKELIKSLFEPPEECLGCGELYQCAGGCRGRVYALADTLDRRDPACKWSIEKAD
jgi:GeoRSP system SPASM domain protein